MKPLVLALTVVLFATLLHLGSAANDFGLEVVASYPGYNQLRFKKEPFLACTMTTNWDVQAGEKTLTLLAGGLNDLRKKVPLDDRPVIMIRKSSSKTDWYCKHVSAAAADFQLSVKGREMLVARVHPRYTYYARQAANNSTEAITTAIAKVSALVAAEKSANLSITNGASMVVITARNEVYVGPIPDTQKKP